MSAPIPDNGSPSSNDLRRLLWWCRLNAALVLTLLIGWVAFHVLVQVPPADAIEIALETEPGHPDAEGHVTHVLAGCAPYANDYDSKASCLVAYADHGSPRLRHLHFRHSGQLTPEAWDLWAVINQEPRS